MNREQMLERLRTALGRPQVGDNSVITRSPGTRLPSSRINVAALSVPNSELVSRFEAELQELAGATYRAATVSELEAILHQILAGTHARRVALSANPVLAELGLAGSLVARGLTVSQWTITQSGGEPAADKSQAASSFREATFDAEVGITGVEFALAETGSLVLTSRTEGTQLVSLAPPVHVALYRESQVLASLDDVLERLAESGGPPAADSGRSVVFVTGTSRTADIEQVLIRGVHGPREVHAILVADACLNHE